MGVTGYDVYRDGTRVASVVGTTFTDTGLRPSTAYGYTVRARDAAGNVSVPSGSVTVTTSEVDTIAPTVPTALTVGATTASTVALTWAASTDSTGVAGYEVYRGATRVATTATTGYTDTGLTAGTAYTYTVRAKDVAGNLSAVSSPVTATTQPDISTPATACTATWRTDNVWGSGFTATITVKNTGTVPLRSWLVTWTWVNGARLSNGWNATFTGSGGSQSAASMPWNGPLAPGASTSFGVQGASSGIPATPVLTCVGSV